MKFEIISSKKPSFHLDKVNKTDDVNCLSSFSPKASVILPTGLAFDTVILKKVLMMS